MIYGVFLSNVEEYCSVQSDSTKYIFEEKVASLSK